MQSVTELKSQDTMNSSEHEFKVSNNYKKRSNYGGLTNIQSVTNVLDQISQGT